MDDKTWESANPQPYEMMGYLIRESSKHGDCDFKDCSHTTPRKFRLMACAFARLFWEKMSTPYATAAVEWAELFADHPTLIQELDEARELLRREMVRAGVDPSPDWVALHTTCSRPQNNGGSVLSVLCNALNVASDLALAHSPNPEIIFVSIIKDVVGNPFKPVKIARKMVTCPACEGNGFVYPGSEADGEESSCAGCNRPAGVYGHWDSIRRQMRCPVIPCIKCGGSDTRQMNPVMGKGKIESPDRFPWVTSQVRTLVDDVYEDRDLPRGVLKRDSLLVLSDALEEAGCPAEERVPSPFEYCHRCGNTGKVKVTNCDYSGWQDCDWCNRKRPHPLLAHLRSPGPHYRGCWALDLVREEMRR